MPKRLTHNQLSKPVFWLVLSTLQSKWPGNRPVLSFGHFSPFIAVIKWGDTVRERPLSFLFFMMCVWTVPCFLFFSECHPSCWLCTGPSAENCTSCPSTSSLHEGRCVPSCPQGFVVQDSQCQGERPTCALTYTHTQSHAHTFSYRRSYFGLVWFRRLWDCSQAGVWLNCCCGLAVPVALSPHVWAH